MKKSIITLPFILILLCSTLPAAPLNFTLHKLESKIKGNTLLIIGGIQGDEPGGFNAASLLVTNYRITKGSIWVVPNLNFLSIIKRSRGVYGDMNRKFSVIKESDPEIETIKKIKELILNENITMVLNLHDGSGFYRPDYIDRMHCPDRWGQSIIIDREKIPSIKKFGDLNKLAQTVAESVNHHLYANTHKYHVKNTRTHLGNTEMEKTLTYFAIKHNIPAFGLEVSKSLLTDKRVYYHLCAIEAFMNMVDIGYEKNFSLTSADVNQTIRNNVQLVLYKNKIFLDMKNARNRLNYMPLKKGSELFFTPSNPLLTIVHTGRSYQVYHGNRRLSKIYPQYFDYDTISSNIKMEIDGTKKAIDFGKMINVNDSFMVVPQNDYRVNVIGYTKKGVSNECGIKICKNDIQKRFSIDKSGQIYRVEVYKDKSFSGMVLINFDDGAERFSISDPSQLLPDRGYQGR